MRRILLLVTVVALMLAMAVAPAFAEPKHKSCKDFGQGVALFAKGNQGQALGRDGPPRGGVGKGVQAQHETFCDEPA
jgi:hypothetical protein